ncbi:MAG TPA: hypothetical protein VHS27_04845 [Gaiellales bacterium]|nr:hypothetical protein [Gaiellales bacterium]
MINRSIPLRPRSLALAAFALAVAVTLVTASTAGATPLKRWQGLRWHTKTTGSVTVAQSRRALRFTLPSALTSDATATYYTRCRVGRNFAAQVHYRLLVWPPANGVRVGLLVNNPDYPTQTDSVTTERTSFGATGDVGSGESYLQNGIASGGGFIVEPTAAMRGTLRVVQQGGTITSQYRDATTGGQFVTITDSAANPAIAPDYGARVSLGLQVWSGPPVFAGPAKVTLTKFRITSGNCTT